MRSSVVTFVAVVPPLLIQLAFIKLWSQYIILTYYNTICAIGGIAVMAVCVLRTLWQPEGEHLQQSFVQ